jgi:uncharacterized protein (DUF433 family)
MASAPAFEIVADPVPLKWWDDGSIRVAGTRLLLELVVHAYNQGETAETIALDMFPPVSVADIHAVIAWYLNHKDAVDAYVAWVDAESERVLAEFEARFPSDELRRSIRERWAAMRAESTPD